MNLQSPSHLVPKLHPQPYFLSPLAAKPSPLSTRPSKSRLTTRGTEETPRLVGEVRRFLETPLPKKKRPFITISENDLHEKIDGRNPFFSPPVSEMRNYGLENANFEADFLKYLEGELPISELIARNNFPREFEKKSGHLLDKSGEAKNGRVTFGKRREFQVKSPNVKQAVGELKKIVQQKILSRKKANHDKPKGNFQIFKLFRYFTNIAEDYGLKIANTDLQSENFDRKYYFRESSTAKSKDEFRLVREKKTLNSSNKNKSAETGVRNLKQENKFRQRLEKHKMKSEVEYFLSKLSRSRELERTLRKKLLHKTLQLSFKFKEKEKSNSISPLKIRKRRIFTDYDIELFDYLLHSKLITECENHKMNEITLGDLCKDESDEILSRRKTYSQNEANSTQPKNMIKIPHIVYSSFKKPQKVPNKKEKNKNQEYYSLYFNIKRNDTGLEDLENKNDREGDESFISNTEAHLDTLYKKSIEIQKKLVRKPDENFSSKFKEIMKLDALNSQILKTVSRKFS